LRSQESARRCRSWSLRCVACVWGRAHTRAQQATQHSGAAARQLSN
jgi:hypothetical protein